MPDRPEPYSNPKLVGAKPIGWQSAYETSPESSSSQCLSSYRSFWAFMAVLVLPLAFALEIITDSLAELNFLNSHELLPVNTQASTLTVWELLSNAKIWQALTFAVMILSVPVFLWGFVVLAKQAKR